MTDYNWFDIGIDFGQEPWLQKAAAELAGKEASAFTNMYYLVTEQGWTFEKLRTELSKWKDKIRIGDRIVISVAEADKPLIIINRGIIAHLDGQRGVVIDPGVDNPHPEWVVMVRMDGGGVGSIETKYLRKL